MALTHFCTVLVVTPISSATSAGSLPSSVTKRTISLLYSSVYLVPLANVDTSSLDRSISHFYVSGKPGNVHTNWKHPRKHTEATSQMAIRKPPKVRTILLQLLCDQR